MKGVILAAPASGSGKTTVAAGLVCALCRQGLEVQPYKTGPDYIDAGFLAAAAGRPCLTLDSWAMRPGTLAAALNGQADIAVVEGAMGLFDGPEGGGGSTADLAALTGWPVVLVVDSARQGQSVAALLEGFAGHRSDIRIAGAVLNRVAGARHEALLCERAGVVPILAALPLEPALVLPSRHLGLVQAGEHPALEAWLARAADLAPAAVMPFGPLRMPLATEYAPSCPPLPPPGQRIAVARDEAFTFAYEHVLAGWRRAGAEFTFFSPLADEAPEGDAVFLPGGYPELYAGRIAAAANFLAALRHHEGPVYGECGGYMVLGEGLEDAAGARHAMAGLLPLETSFATPARRLGYRRLKAKGGSFSPGAVFRGHEFHYARIIREGPGAPLFEAADAPGRPLGLTGLVRGRTAGSFMHLIDTA
ncbi:MAG: cobyrinate a,c-diamide synthase [Alphaproteobacteria bacterium]|nr:cobyrinate a,c-diamide synthase [Alphaproteobacteria bacterium]MCY4317829.1 cobyrinate a,c-diamide synthase [Alphaproteobacteria bacterium]